jgi:uncharacterized protein (TIGR03435 family)
MGVFRKSSPFTPAGLVWIFAALQFPCLAQPPQPAFDVASIKLSSADLKMSQTQWDPGRLFGQEVTLKQLIQWAYQVTDAQVSARPDWVDTKRFDIEAKSEGSHTRDELLRMLQPLLAERFRLALHREMKEQTVDVLAVGKNGLKRQEPQTGRPASITMQPGPGPGDSMILRVTGQSVSMRYLAEYLTNLTGRVVVDRSNFAGSFDFQSEVSWTTSVITDKRSPVTDALIDAMRQIGLNLSSEKMPIEILVVDHAEEPTDN